MWESNRKNKICLKFAMVLIFSPYIFSCGEVCAEVAPTPLVSVSGDSEKYTSNFAKGIIFEKKSQSANFANFRIFAQNNVSPAKLAPEPASVMGPVISRPGDAAGPEAGSDIAEQERKFRRANAYFEETFQILTLSMRPRPSVACRNANVSN